ncbi:MAG: PLP-dependent aminotransferase family protein, partial [Pseudomonadota bacterium]
ALSSQGWTHSPSSLLFAGNGRQAIAAAFSALAPLGGRVGFEELTYPVAKAIATRLGMEAIPIPCDDDGLRPDGLEQAHRDSRLHAVYLQPTLQNPLGMTMSAQRRSELATVLTRLNGPVVVEDRVYAFLEEAAPPPLAAFAHDHVVVVDSLSKIVAPGLTLGFVCAPEHLITPLANALIVGAWAPQRFSFEIGVRWLCDGSAEALKAAKRLDALKRQSIARTALKGLDIRANPTAYHLLLALPPHWRAEAYALAAERRGIAITPGAAFAVASGFAPNLVRLALAPPALDDLSVALGTLSALARSKTESDFVRWSG